VDAFGVPWCRALSHADGVPAFRPTHPV
jgi:hypothetical protein